MSLANIFVILSLMAACLWGLKSGLFEMSLRLLGVVGASLVTMCSFAPAARLLQEAFLKEQWGLAYAASWTGIFVISGAALWLLGNVLLLRGRVAFYSVLDHAAGVFCALATVLFLLSALLIGIQFSPGAPWFLAHFQGSNQDRILAENAIPELYSRLLDKPKEFDPNAFIAAVKMMHRPSDAEEGDPAGNTP